ncbi:peroxiredoxin [Patescibacteria group bacterium]|nr:peroxiredoxin [Patescibacteria group bacterium]
MSVGEKAPVFSAKDQKGKTHRLADYKGEWLLIYFYPRDFTSGCTREACEFRDNFEQLKKKVNIVGVSADSQESHAKFAAKHDLPFTLLADKKRQIISAYGAKVGIFTRRFSYLIGPEGRIAKIYRSVNPKIHAKQILKDLETFHSP